MFEVVGRPILAFVLDPRQKIYSQLVGAGSLVGKMPASLVMPDTLMPGIRDLVQQYLLHGWHMRRLMYELKTYLGENIQRVRALSLDFQGTTCSVHLTTADDSETYYYLLEVEGLVVPSEPRGTRRRRRG